MLVETHLLKASLKGSTFSPLLISAGPKNKDTPIHLNELMKLN